MKKKSILNLYKPLIVLGLAVTYTIPAYADTLAGEHVKYNDMHVAITDQGHVFHADGEFWYSEAGKFILTPDEIPTNIPQFTPTAEPQTTPKVGTTEPPKSTDPIPESDPEAQTTPKVGKMEPPKSTDPIPESDPEVLTTPKVGKMEPLKSTNSIPDPDPEAQTTPKVGKMEPPKSTNSIPEPVPEPLNTLNVGTTEQQIPKDSIDTETNDRPASYQKAATLTSLNGLNSNKDNQLNSSAALLPKTGSENSMNKLLSILGMILIGIHVLVVIKRRKVHS
ncbi:LPXTG cell wall anchor domain-containing protein [Enterococcus sp. AZ196]|uniref:LPXTG cell wall anchor domain-containing protein n=1 Tax=Enterococcus sp. AZ196 TaxID=2774659 RepID=UPI003D296F09